MIVLFILLLVAIGITFSFCHVDELVSITHPVSVGYVIDPNSVAPFTAPDVQIINNSTIPIRVSVQNLSATAGGSLTLNDVPPSKYADWSKLTSAQTKSDIAFGLVIRETVTGSGTWSRRWRWAATTCPKPS